MSEPLSEELEAKISVLLDEAVIDGRALRAFAREILQNAEKELEQSIAQRVDLLRAADRQGAALLASQESCRLLAEALEMHTQEDGKDIVHFGVHHRITTAAVCDVCAALAAYRSSEAGKEKAI